MDIKRLSRWWVVGLAFYVLNLAVLYVLTARLRMPLMLSTLLAAEMLALMRFWVNDRWVFGQRQFQWMRLWQYHLANGASFAVWWSVTNVLPVFGIHYLVAATLATVSSVGLTMLTHFSWIWRRGGTGKVPRRGMPEGGELAGEVGAPAADRPGGAVGAMETVDRD